jgi:hypothetical protein
VSTAQHVWEVSRTALADADGVIVVLRIFMDESGTHDPSPVITVGAAWARPSVWKLWTKDWNVAKRPIRIHHSTDCHNRVGEWEGWERADRDNYVKAILPVIAKHEICGRIGGLHLESYRRGIANRPDVAAALGDPYVACFQWAVTDICEAARLVGRTRLAFIHENNDRRESAMRSFDYAKARFPDLKMSLVFGGKDEFVPLQCADTFAFEGNRRLRDTNAPVRKPMEVMDPVGNRIGFVEWDEQNMPLLVTEMCRHFDELRAAGRVPLKYLGGEAA